jgi:hypothetical protein
MLARLFLSLFVVLALCRCNSGDIVELPTVEPRLTIGFVGENDRPWKGYVTTSKTVLGPGQFESVVNASVRIFEDGNLVETLTYMPGSDLGSLPYRGQVIRPQPGHQYRIEVSASPYHPVTASYQHPEHLDIESFEIDRFVPVSTDAPNAEFKITFTDPSVENFYELFLVFDDGNFTYQIVVPELVDPAYKEHKQVFATTIFNDILFNGTRTTLLLKGRIPEWAGVNDSCVVHLRNLSPEYYEYLRGINLQRIGADDPFAQPVFIKGNVTSGHGVFGGYSQSRKEIVIGN